MKLFALLVLMLLIFTCVTAYMLHQKGLLTRETLDLLVKSRSEAKEEKPAPVEPVGLAATIQKKEQVLREESERLERLSARLEAQRQELKAERALIGKQLKSRESGSEAGLATIGGEAEKLARLVKMYEGMDPEEAAAILEGLPDPVAAQILVRMRSRQATRIMGSLAADKATDISELLIPAELEAAR